MAMTEKQKQTAFRERMYNAGYKQMRIWVKRNSETKPVKLERKAFARKLEELTAGWSKAKLSRLFSEIVRTLEKEAKGKK